MADEFETCAAAFFRIKGKDVVTEKEFTMAVALDFKWMSARESEQLLKILIGKGILTKNNGYVKAAKDLSSVQVPIAYKPSDTIKKTLTGTIQPVAKPPMEKPKDIFVELMDIAVENGIPKGQFVSECNIIKKKLGIDICVAALLLLRDNGADIGKIKDLVHTQVLKN